jgi:hypothetical protein
MPKTKPPRRPKQKGDYQYKIPLDELEEMAKRHCTDDEIADYYGCTKDTIAKRKRNDPAFRAAYIKGKSSGKMSLRSLLWKSCLDGNVTAQIWMSKQHLGMRDVTALEHSGPQGASIESVTTVRIEYVDDDEKNVDSDD